MTMPAPAASPAAPPAVTLPVTPPVDTSKVTPPSELKGADGKPVLGPDGKPVTVTPAATPPDPNKPYTIKVNGKEVNVSLQELQVMAQKGAGADQKFQHAAVMRQQAEQFIHLLKTNPVAVLTNPQLGLDFRKLAEDFMTKQFERETLTPEQRELLETKEKLQLAEEEKHATAQKQQQERMAQLQAHYTKQYEADIVKTLETSGLPRTKSTVKRMAYYMSEGLKHGVELKAADVVDMVKNDYISEHNELYGATDGDTLLALLGDSTIKKLMESQLKKIKSAGGTPATPRKTPAGGETPPVEGAKKLNKDEWRKHMDEKFGGPVL